MKRKYIKDYVSGAQEESRFQYVGDYFTHDMDEAQCKKKGLIQLLCAVGAIVLLMAAGFMDSPGTYTLYVLLPMVCMLLPMVYYIMGAWAFAHVEKRMERYQYEASFLRMFHSVCIGLFFNLFALCGDVVLVVRMTREGTMQGNESEYFLLAVLVVLAAVHIAAFRYHKELMNQVRQEKQK